MTTTHGSVYWHR